MSTSQQQGAIHNSMPATPADDRRRNINLPLVLVLAIGAGLLFLLCLPLLVASSGYVYYQMTGRIAPGVRVGESRLSWMTVEDAAVLLQKDWNMGRRLVVSDGLQSWSISTADLGLSVNAIQTARTAFDYARRQSMWAEFKQMVHSWLGGAQVAPIAALDVDAARSALQALDLQAQRPAQDAVLSWDGNQLVATPSQLGYAINITRTLQDLQPNAGIVLTSGYFQVSLAPLIPQLADVSGAMAEAEKLLNAPLTLRAYDPISDEYFNWNVPKEEVGGWLKFDASDTGPVVGIDQAKLGAYLSSLGEGMGGDHWLDGAKYGEVISQAIIQGGQPLIMVSHKPTTYIVQPGDTLIAISWKVGLPYWTILNSNPDLNPDALLTGQSLVIPSKDEMLPLPVIPNKRIVIGIGQQRLWVYQDGNLLSKHVISTGIDRSPTQPGVFQVQTHELNAYASVWDLTMPHFLGVYEAWPGFMNGIHGLPMLSTGRRLWKNILGKPASYGCIIMDLDEAEWLYNWAEDGVVVEIKP
jgi:lipoprotein-anchoring transpeptidase ErfK/SrfK